jgi:Fic family protein
MKVYNWQQDDWRQFEYDPNLFQDLDLRLMELSGQSFGFLNALPQSNQDESIITILVKEAIKTSAIEGELISRVDVISSIKKNLGFPTPSLTIKDKRSEGIAELLVKSRETFDLELSEAMLSDWHKLLMRGNYSIEVGQWRTHAEPMQIVSGAMGKEKVHFEAPPSSQVETEMKTFIEWFNQSRQTIKSPIIRSSIAHLYFESIHPFEDGNGRIGRIIAEKSLAQSFKRPILMSLSTAIEANKNEYYKSLQKAQRSNQINDWISYFGATIIKAQEDFIKDIDFYLRKARFFDINKHLLNERQQKVLKRMLEEGEDFYGGLNARKYQAIAKTSKATATRDLQDLIQKELIYSKSSGRGTNYQIKL